MGLSTTFNLRNVGGVYIIFKKNTMVYCGYSKTNLYKTLYRHFQEWKTSSQVRTIYKNLNDITVRVIYCKDGNQASRLEKAIIIKYKPRDNTNKYNQYTMDFKEKEIFDLVSGLKVQPIIQNEEENPF
jgi:excinuclease UvrABC nuclease subunit